MQKVVYILDQIADVCKSAWGLPAERVFHDPDPSELPDTGAYAAIRCELVGGRRETVAFDVMTLRIEVAAELEDPGTKRRQDRMLLLKAFRDRVSHWSGSLYPPIEGYEEPVVVEALTTSVQDAPGWLIVGCSIEGEVTLPRGGYEGG